MVVCKECHMRIHPYMSKYEGYEVSELTESEREQLERAIENN